MSQKRKSSRVNWVKQVDEQENNELPTEVPRLIKEIYKSLKLRNSFNLPAA